MRKVAIWKNRDKVFSLTPQHAAWLMEHGYEIPQYENYDNFSEVLIDSIEAMQKGVSETLKTEYRLYTCLQEKRTHFAHVFDSFEIYVIRIWIQILTKNPHIICNPRSESIFNSMMYYYSWEAFLQICDDMKIKIDDDFEVTFTALLSRREAMLSVMRQRDDAHAAYIKFCDDMGMKAFSHIPTISGFEILEYDESKYQAQIIKHSKNNQVWEELVLIPMQPNSE